MSWLFLVGICLFSCKEPSKELSNEPIYYGNIELGLNHIVYIGVPNPISIETNIDKPIEWRCTGCEITNIVKGGATIRSRSPGRLTVIAGYMDGDNFVSVQTREFKSRRLPDPIPFIGKNSNGSIKAPELKVQGGVRAVLESFPGEIKFTVLSFELALAAHKGGIEICRNDGYRFSEKCQNLINKAQKGDIVTVNNIKVKGPSGKERTLSSLALYVD